MTFIERYRQPGKHSCLEKVISGWMKTKSKVWKQKIEMRFKPFVVIRQKWCSFCFFQNVKEWMERKLKGSWVMASPKTKIKCNAIFWKSNSKHPLKHFEFRSNAKEEKKSHDSCLKLSQGKSFLTYSVFVNSVWPQTPPIISISCKMHLILDTPKNEGN